MTPAARFRGALGRAAATLLVAGLGLAGTAPGPAAAAPDPGADADVLHLLSRATYGPRPGDVARLRALGLRTWLEQQLDPDRIDDRDTERRLQALPTLGMTIPELLRGYPRPDPRRPPVRPGGAPDRREAMAPSPPERRPARLVAELQAARAVRAVMSERQLYEVMVEFWFNHFNVHAGKGAVRWFVGPYERDAIRPHALGRFRDLLGATARHPAMLFYLDNWLSARDGVTVPGPDGPRRGGLNENYARELLELHTLGVDGGYTQRDVREVARAFTGWSIERPQVTGRYVFRPRWHDPGEKLVLGRRLPPGGEQDGERVLDRLARHPATARFIATKLARRFVGDDPPTALVERVAAEYRRTDGDVRAMLRVLFAAPEFWGPEARAAKVKRPFEFVVSAVRALGGEVDAAGGLALARAAARIGEPLYLCEPPAGYADRAEPWVNPGALLGRLNFALDLAAGRLPGVRVDVERLASGADPARPAEVLDRLLAAVVPGGVGAHTRAVLEEHLRSPEITRLSLDDRGPARTHVPTLLALVLGAPEFQRR